jgi:hypothetical protein
MRRESLLWEVYVLRFEEALAPLPEAAADGLLHLWLRSGRVSPFLAAILLATTVLQRDDSHR